MYRVAEVKQLGLPVCSETSLVDVSEWRKKQAEYRELAPVLEWVRVGQRPSREEVSHLSPGTKRLRAGFQALRLAGGVLQRGWVAPATGEVTWQLVVPRVLRQTVLEQLHGGLGSGHLGTTKTLRRLRKGFYWGRHKRDVEDFCRQCDSCAPRKGPPGQSHVQLQQVPSRSSSRVGGGRRDGPLPCVRGGK